MSHYAPSFVPQGETLFAFIQAREVDPMKAGKSFVFREANKKLYERTQAMVSYPGVAGGETEQIPEEFRGAFAEFLDVSATVYLPDSEKIKPWATFFTSKAYRLTLDGLPSHGKEAVAISKFLGYIPVPTNATELEGTDRTKEVKFRIHLTNNAIVTLKDLIDPPATPEPLPAAVALSQPLRRVPVADSAPVKSSPLSRLARSR